MRDKSTSQSSPNINRLSKKEYHIIRLEGARLIWRSLSFFSYRSNMKYTELLKLDVIFFKDIGLIQLYGIS